jgi:S1-C subfamily serine protease
MTQAPDTSGIVQSLSDALAAAVERAAASVVAVNARRRLPATGVALEGGVIVTADHVIEREEDLSVLLPNGQTAAARLAGRDPSTDLAVLRTDGATLPGLAGTGQARVGSFALAVGRPGQGGPEVSLGVVSAVGGPARTRRGGQIEGYIRTDAILYPGFSGGPLIDASGAMLGINTSGLWRGSGVCLTDATVRRVVQALSTHGKIRRGFLGISSQPIKLPEALAQQLGGQSSGLLIVGTEAGGPADQGGVMVGDILIGLGGETVADTEDLQRLLGGERIGQATPVRVLRGGEPRELSVTVGERG